MRLSVSTIIKAREYLLVSSSSFLSSLQDRLSQAQVLRSAKVPGNFALNNLLSAPPPPWLTPFLHALTARELKAVVWRDVSTQVRRGPRETLPLPKPALCLAGTWLVQTLTHEQALLLVCLRRTAWWRALEASSGLRRQTTWASTSKVSAERTY